MSDDEKIASAFAALEGMHAVRTLVLAAVKPAAASSDRAMDLVVVCLDFAAAKMESCASAPELACTHMSAKKCANHAHRKLGSEERRRQKGELLLTRGIKELSAKKALRHALEDATATFARLSPKPSMEPQQPLTI